MRSVPIHRLVSHSNLGAPPPTDAYVYFAHPYSMLDPFISHVHPRFIICDAGRKLKEGGASLAFAFSRLHPTHVRVLEMVVDIWTAWTTVADNPDFKTFITKPSTDDIISNNSRYIRSTCISA